MRARSRTWTLTSGKCMRRFLQAYKMHIRVPFCRLTKEYSCSVFEQGAANDAAADELRNTRKEARLKESNCCHHEGVIDGLGIQLLHVGYCEIHGEQCPAVGAGQGSIQHPVSLLQSPCRILPPLSCKPAHITTYEKMHIAHEMKNRLSRSTEMLQR